MKVVQRVWANSLPLGLIGVVGSLAFLFILAIGPAWLSYRSTEWSEIPCTIESSQIIEEPPRTSYVKVRYRYVVDRSHYVGDRISFSRDQDDSYRDDLANRFRPGAKSVCYVNPADPSDAVLVRELDVIDSAAILPFILLAASLIMIWLGRKYRVHGE